MESYGIHEILTIKSYQIQFYEDLIDVSHIQNVMVQRRLLLRGETGKALQGPSGPCGVGGFINPVLALFTYSNNKFYLFPTQIVSIDNSIKSCVFKAWKKWWSPPHPVPVRTVEGAKSCVFTWPSWPSAIIRCSSTSMDSKVARSDFLGGTPGSIKTLGKSLGNAKENEWNHGINWAGRW